VTQEQTKTQSQSRFWATHPLNNSYYTVLGVSPSASVIEVRRAYRELSKRYHPDTTKLPVKIATAKFQQLNEAYATLSSPDRRLLYDAKIGYSRYNVIQAPPDLDSGTKTAPQAAYLDPTDRPLSSGEIFALFILGITFIGCLILAIVIGLTRGDVIEPVPEFSQSYQTLKIVAQWLSYSLQV
jgi:hypothetical protein